VAKFNSVGAAQIHEGDAFVISRYRHGFSRRYVKAPFGARKDIVAATLFQTNAAVSSFDYYLRELAHVTSGLKRVKLLPTGCLLIRLKVSRQSLPIFNLGTENGQLARRGLLFL